MSSQENEARKQLRTGIRGEYEMRPLDEFTVTSKPAIRPDVVVDQALLWKTFPTPVWGVAHKYEVTGHDDRITATEVVESWRRKEQELLDLQQDMLAPMFATFLGVLTTMPTLPEEAKCPPEFIHALRWNEAMKELGL